MDWVFICVGAKPDANGRRKSIVKDLIFALGVWITIVCCWSLLLCRCWFGSQGFVLWKECAILPDSSNDALVVVVTIRFKDKTTHHVRVNISPMTSQLKGIFVFHASRTCKLSTVIENEMPITINKVDD